MRICIYLRIVRKSNVHERNANNPTSTKAKHSPDGIVAAAAVAANMVAVCSLVSPELAEQFWSQSAHTRRMHTFTHSASNQIHTLLSRAALCHWAESKWCTIYVKCAHICTHTNICMRNKTHTPFSCRCDQRKSSCVRFVCDSAVMSFVRCVVALDRRRRRLSIAIVLTVQIEHEDARRFVAYAQRITPISEGIRKHTCAHTTSG